MEGATKQVIKYKVLVKQRKYTDTNTSVGDVFRTQVNIYNGAFFAKIVNGFLFSKLQISGKLLREYKSEI